MSILQVHVRLWFRVQRNDVQCVDQAREVEEHIKTNVDCQIHREAALHSHRNWRHKDGDKDQKPIASVHFVCVFTKKEVVYWEL